MVISLWFLLLISPDKTKHNRRNNQSQEWSVSHQLTRRIMIFIQGFSISLKFRVPPFLEKPTLFYFIGIKERANLKCWISYWDSCEAAGKHKQDKFQHKDLGLVQAIEQLALYTKAPHFIRLGSAFNQFKSKLGFTELVNNVLTCFRLWTIRRSLDIPKENTGIIFNNSLFLGI